MLQDQIIILTGGSGFLGQEFSKAIVNNGGIVIIADISIDEEVFNTFSSSNIEFFSTDVTKKESVQDLIKYVHKKYNKIDSWINNAYPQPIKANKNRSISSDFIDMDYDFFKESVRTYIGSIFICTQQISKYFINQGYGNIVNISSIYGSIAPKFEIYEKTDMTMPFDYALNKCSVNQLTKYLAKYFKGKNIRVNSLSPGGIEQSQPISFINRYKNISLNNSMTNKEELSNSVLFLLSENSKSINGQNIIADDGWSL
tara:strand:+ start:95 stop:865 length:771 start_codon:yes stop_codon:yes gene_type:complete